MDMPNIGRKGDVDRYMMFTIVLLVMLVIALLLLYTGAYGFIESTFMEQLK